MLLKINNINITWIIKPDDVSGCKWNESIFLLFVNFVNISIAGMHLTSLLIRELLLILSLYLVLWNTCSHKQQFISSCPRAHLLIGDQGNRGLQWSLQLCMFWKQWVWKDLFFSVSIENEKKISENTFQWHTIFTYMYITFFKYPCSLII